METLKGHGSVLYALAGDGRERAHYIPAESATAFHRRQTRIPHTGKNGNAPLFLSVSSLFSVV